MNPAETPPAEPPAAGAGVETTAPPPATPETKPAGEAPTAAVGEEAAAAPTPAISEGQQPPPTPIPAVWYDRDIQFAYMPRTTYYTCDGLKSKVSKILDQMGVRPGYKVTIGSCFEAQGMSAGGMGYSSRSGYMMPTVRIRGAFPTEATPEVLAELSKTSSERELLRRYEGLPTDFDPALDQFAAVRTVIVFKDGKLGPIEAGDCELIETLRDKVFVPVGMRVVEDRMSCQPGQVSMGSISMKVEILEQPQPAEATPEKDDKSKSKLTIEPSVRTGGSAPGT